MVWNQTMSPCDVLLSSNSMRGEISSLSFLSVKESRCSLQCYVRIITEGINANVVYPNLQSGNVKQSDYT